MFPFWGLIKQNSHFIRNQDLKNTFHQPKKFIIGLVKKSIMIFNINWVICLALDWSKEGIGFLILHKYYISPNKKAQVCCPESWHIVYAGSQFFTKAKCHYASTEGKAAIITLAIDKCYIFIMGCSNVIVVTDYQPLT